MWSGKHSGNFSSPRLALAFIKLQSCNTACFMHNLNYMSPALLFHFCKQRHKIDFPLTSSGRLMIIFLKKSFSPKG